MITSHASAVPTPATLRHVISVWFTVTLHACAAYDVPSALTYRTLGAFHGATAPRLLPLNRTDSPPVVDITVRPGNPVIVGTAYDVVALELPLTCAPTVTRHRKLPPTPSTLLHSTSLCATTTLQFAALNNSARPDDVAYCAVTTLPLSGPRFVPTIRTFVPPDVGIDASGSEPATADSDVIAGGVYDTFADAGDKLLLWPPTDTTQRWFVPTPALLLHVIVVCDTVTTHAVAVYVVPAAPP
jgi:hypothetical protein